MKKSFFGYNVQEVDESIEMLEASKAKLEKLVKNLNGELDKVRAELAEERAKAFANEAADDSEEFEKKYHEASKEISALKQDISRLTQKNSQLSAQIATYDEESLKNGIEQAGVICREAYEDMANAKSNSKSAIEAFCVSFWDMFDKYEHKMYELYDELAAKNENSRESFLIAADEILQNYSNIRNEDNLLKNAIKEIDSIRAGAQNEIAALLSGLTESGNSTISEFTAEETTDEELGNKYQSSILREIANMHKIKAEQEKPTPEENKKQSAEEQPSENILLHPAAPQRESISLAKSAEPEKTQEEVTDDSYIADVTLDVDKRNIV